MTRRHESRLRVIEARNRGAEPVEIGGGRRLRLSSDQKHETLLDAVGGFETPTIEAIRCGRGEPDAGRFAQMIAAFDPAHRRPPSGDAESPWVDSDDDGPAADIVDPQDVPGGGPEDHLG